MPRKKGGVNKSEAIRQALAANPKAKVSEIVAALASKGIRVSPKLAYLVKAKARGRHRKQKRQQAIAAGRAAGNSDPVALVQSVKQLAAKAGGMRRLKELVDILAD